VGWDRAGRTAATSYRRERAKTTREFSVRGWEEKIELHEKPLVENAPKKEEELKTETMRRLYLARGI